MSTPPVDKNNAQQLPPMPPPKEAEESAKKRVDSASIITIKKSHGYGKASAKSRCMQPGCRRRLSLHQRDLACRCGKVFCDHHRFFTDHHCTFDYHTHWRSTRPAEERRTAKNIGSEKTGTEPGSGSAY